MRIDYRYLDDPYWDIEDQDATYQTFASDPNDVPENLKEAQRSSEWAEWEKVIKKYKARLVAKGCSQRPGYDYQEPFSLVVRMETVRTILLLALSIKKKTQNPANGCKSGVSEWYIKGESLHETTRRI